MIRAQLKLIALIAICEFIAVKASAQPAFEAFAAGSGWAGIRGATPNGEPLCLVQSKIGDSTTIAIRASRRSIMLVFSDSSLATTSQVPTQIQFLITQQNSQAPFVLTGISKEIGQPGSGSMLLEAPPDAQILNTLEKSSSLYVKVRGSTVGPYALPRIDTAIAALRNCLSKL